MTETSIVISDQKSKKTYSKKIENPFVGKKIGDTVSGNSIGLTNYELKITGGSDFAGFPMRPEIQGSIRKRLSVKKKKNLKFLKTFVGNQITDQTNQINLKVLKPGTKSIPELWNIQEKPKEEKTEEKK
jgi:small subunit ribosomal protein S6e